jgi:ABC-type transport system substrate-binding protein
LDTYDLSQNHIRPREYDALLYVQAPDSGPNLFSYWHSSQRDGAGLNLSLFSNKTMDEILEKAKVAVGRDALDDLNRQFQDVLFEKNPGIYLFSPIRLYPVDKKVFGIRSGRVIDYSDRLGSVESWYINTKREWKK